MDSDHAVVRRPAARSSRERRERRNLLERQHVERRKKGLEQMRVVAAQLEQEKRNLEARYGQNLLMAEEAANAAQQGVDDPFKQAQRRYFQVLQDVEQLRLQNRTLMQEMTKFEIFRNAMHDIVDQVPPVAELEPEPPMEPHFLSKEQAHGLVYEMFMHLNQVHERVHIIPSMTQTEVFGWSDRQFKIGDFVDFAVSKKFYNQSAEALCLKSWSLFREKETAMKMIPAMGRPGAGPVTRQVIDFNTVIVHGFAQASGQEALAHAAKDLLLARATYNGKWMLILCYFDAEHIEDRSMIQRCFSWHFEDMPVDETGMPSTRVQVGGSVINASDAMVRRMISEHVFVVVRWESLAINQRRLVWG